MNDDTIKQTVHLHQVIQGSICSTDAGRALRQAEPKQVRARRAAWKRSKTGHNSQHTTVNLVLLVASRRDNGRGHSTNQEPSRFNQSIYGGVYRVCVYHLYLYLHLSLCLYLSLSLFLSMYLCAVRGPNRGTEVRAAEVQLWTLVLGRFSRNRTQGGGGVHAPKNLQLIRRRKTSGLDRVDA